MHRVTAADWGGGGPLASAAARGGVVATVAAAVRFLVQLGGTVLLARLLGPAEYGFAVVVVVIAGLGELLRTGGVSALINREHTLSDGSVATFHLISVSAGIGIGVGVAAAAPGLAGLTGFSGASGLVAALALVFPAAGLAAVPGALLARNLRFRVLVTVEVSAMLLGVVVAVIVALCDGGASALAVQAVLAALGTMAGLVAACPWRPARPVGLRAVRRELGFVTNVTLVQALTFLARNIDRVLVAAVAGPVAAALYTQASQLVVLPLDQVGGAAQRVAVPVLARLTHDRARFRRTYRRIVLILTMALWPLFAALVPLASGVLQVLFGAAWVDAAPLFRVLALSGFAQTVGYVSTWVFLASGQSGRQLAWTLVTRPFVTASCLAAGPWGATGVAIASACTAIALVLPGFRVAGRVPGLRASDLVAPLAGPALVAAVAGAVAWLAVAVTTALDPAVALVVGCVLAAVSSAMVVLVMPPLRRELVLIAKLLQSRQPVAGQTSGSSGGAT